MRIELKESNGQAPSVFADLTGDIADGVDVLDWLSALVDGETLWRPLDAAVTVRAADDRTIRTVRLIEAGDVVPGAKRGLTALRRMRPVIGADAFAVPNDGLEIVADLFEKELDVTIRQEGRRPLTERRRA